MLSVIVAVDNNGVIGKGNALPWKLKNDMRHFVKKTTGKTVIMGRKPFESIGHALPNRHNIVLTRQPICVDGVEVIHSLKNIIDKYWKSPEEVFVIGGEELYKQLLPFATKIYMTHVLTNVKGGDAKMPNVNLTDWKTISLTRHEADADNDHSHYIWEIIRA